MPPRGKRARVQEPITAEYHYDNQAPPPGPQVVPGSAATAAYAGPQIVAGSAAAGRQMQAHVARLQASMPPGSKTTRDILVENLIKKGHSKTQANAMLAGLPQQILDLPDIMDLLPHAGAKQHDPFAGSDDEDDEDDEPAAEDDDEVSNASLDADELALFEAVEEGDLDEVTRLLDLGNDVDICDPCAGNISLLMSSASCDHDVWRLLLARGATPNTVDDEGGTALHRACMTGNDKLVRELLKAGAIVAPDFFGKTPFHHMHGLKAATVKALRKADNTGVEAMQDEY